MTSLASLGVALKHALQLDKVILQPAQLQRLAALIHYSARARVRGPRRIASGNKEILAQIEVARDSGDTNEAVWRALLGAHFARLSASTKDGSAESASRFLCAFGEEPFWTWGRVTADRGKALKAWLADTHAVLSLTFGNHRSHEQPNHVDLWMTIKSFLDLATSANGPANVIKAPGAANAGHRFDLLYRKLAKIHRFGRLARFDFIDLLLVVGLVKDAEPAHCYLKGATGPLKGARMIWGNKSEEVLDQLAAKLAQAIDISCFVLEDALCNFQKPHHEPCCGDPDDDGSCAQQ